MAASGRATWHADDIMTSAMTSSRGSGLANVSMTNADVSVDRSTLNSYSQWVHGLWGPLVSHCASLTGVTRLSSFQEERKWAVRLWARSGIGLDRAAQHWLGSVSANKSGLV